MQGNNPSVAQVETHEDPDPYPLWPRPTASTTLKEAPRMSTSPGVLASSYIPPSPRSPPPVGAVPGRRTPPCQYPACRRYAKYGPKDAMPSACQEHKRAGQYTTNRHGELLMATRDGPESDQSRWRPTAAHGTSSSSRRKAAEPSSTSVQGLTRTNRPGLSSGYANERLEPQHRPCLFPGCDARPDYGLPGAARAVYCFSHKKSSMVRVFKEALGLQDKGENTTSATTLVASRKVTAGKSRIKASAAAAGDKKKKSRTPTTTEKNGAKKGRRGPRVKEEGGSSEGSGEHNSKKSPGNGMMSAFIERNLAGGGLTTTTDKDPGTVTNTAPPSMFASAAATTTMPPSPPTNRPTVVTSGMAPSAEILLLKQAREAAKKEAEAAGSGKRPRAPSRRALEASGRMKDEGAQWMTWEKKAAEARVKTELREQRKQYKAAGLKVGVVLEAFVTGTAGVAATGSEGGSGVGGGVGIGGGRGGEGGDGGAEPPRIDAGWQKVSPVVL